MANCPNCGLSIDVEAATCLRCGQTLSRAPHDEPTLIRKSGTLDLPTEPTLAPAAGTAPAVPVARLGKYELQGELGRGGMGVVYKAWDPQLHRAVALKMLLVEGGAEGATPSTLVAGDALERFLREGRAVARLDHPGIVRVHEVGSDGNRHFLCMDYVEGTSFQKMLEAPEPPPLRRCLEVLRDVARALAHAHSRGILHRDLKPSNLLVAKDGVVKLTDFGLARDLTSQASKVLTASGTLLGTPQYMSPEQVQADPSRLGPATDIWAIGVMLYQVLTRRYPFDAPSLNAMFARILKEDPVPPRRIDPLLPREAEVVCLKCLEKPPALRYASAEALAADLDALLAGGPIEARAVPFTTRLLRKAFRHRAVVIPSLIAVLLAAGLGTYALIARRERAEKARAEEMLRKSGLVQEVLARWASLAEPLRAMEETFYDSSLGDEAKRQRSEAAWRRVQEFMDETPKDPTSQAAMKAFAGWARRLAGREDEGKAWMQEAARLDPDLPYGALTEALGCLSEYLSKQGLPMIVLGPQGLRFGRPPEERPEMRAMRERMEGLLAKAAEASVWGKGMAQDFRTALSAMQEMQEGRYAQAEADLSTVMGRAVVQVFRSDLLFMRARLRYLQLKIDDGLADMEEVAAARRGQGQADHFIGQLHLAKATDAMRQGKDPSQEFHLAEASYAASIQKAPNFLDAYVNLATAEMTWSRDAAKRGEDPSARLQKAIPLYDAVIRAYPAYTDAWLDRGLAKKDLGEAAITRGVDPSTLYESAAKDMDEALRQAPQWAEAYVDRGLLSVARGNAELARGADPGSLYQGAVADYDRALAMDSTLRAARTNRAQARMALAEAQKSPEAMKPALAELDAVLKEDAGDVDALCLRGEAWRWLAEMEVTRKADPAPDLDRAMADFDEALRREPTRLEALLGRAQVLARRAKQTVEKAADPSAICDDALGVCERALGVNPRCAAARVARGAALVAQGEWEARQGRDPSALWGSALGDFDEALKLDRCTRGVHKNRALILGRLGRLQEAIDEYGLALQEAGGQDAEIAGAIADLKKLAAHPWAATFIQADQALQQGENEESRDLYEAGLKAAGEEAERDPSMRNRLQVSHYNLACLHAVLSLGQKKMNAPPDVPTAEEAKGMRDQAFLHLGKAVDLGLADRKALEADAYLVPLQADARWAALLARLPK